MVVLDGNKQLEKYINLTAKDYPSLKALVVYAEDVLDQVRRGQLSTLRKYDMPESGVGPVGVGWDTIVCNMIGVMEREEMIQDEIGWNGIGGDFML